MRLDPRAALFRADLAEHDLAGRVSAAAFARPVSLTCRVAETPLRAQPSPVSPQVSALLGGEDFDAVEVGPRWSWGRCRTDGYTGYVETDALDPRGQSPTHLIAAGDALVFAEPALKSPVRARLPINARVVAGVEAGDFVAAWGGWIHRRHLSTAWTRDPVPVGLAFVGTPYRWGGRTRAGIDCSGLTQAVLLACGVRAPRDSDQQAAAVGRPVPLAGLGPGDLVFMPGHVGLMIDDHRLLHANAHWMATVVEPLVDVLARLPDGATASARRWTPAAGSLVDNAGLR